MIDVIPGGTDVSVTTCCQTLAVAVIPRVIDVDALIDSNAVADPTEVPTTVLLK
jgi:hypothetical protein